MRIGGGIWKGRRLPAAPGHVRPTTAQSREVLFSWLGKRVCGRHCLDLFAGSGALSLEAVSRGAATATLLEIDSRVCRALRRQLTSLRSSSETTGLADCLSIVQTDSQRWLHRTARQPAEKRPQQWNLIFADPPYDYRHLTDCLQLTHELMRTAAPAEAQRLLYLETRPAATPSASQLPVGWALERERTASDHRLQLYRLNTA